MAEEPTVPLQSDGLQPGHDIFCTPNNDSFHASSLYSELDVAQQEIRLVKLWPGSGDDAIDCTLLPGARVRDLEGQYTAPSYCAGSAKNTEPIVLNGTTFNVFANLAHALREVRQFWSTTYGDRECLLWVDQISINQYDINERSTQVRFMREIYEYAEQVLVCLSTKRSDPRGMSWLIELASDVRPRGQDEIPEPERRRFIGSYGNHQNHQDSQGKNKMEEDKVVDPAPAMMHGSVDTTPLGAPTSMQPDCVSAGLYSEDELPVPSLEERQAGEDVIMADMLTAMQLEGMEVSPPSPSNRWTNMGVEADREASSISAELNEQRPESLQASDRSAHSDSLTATGFADDEQTAQPEEYADDFDSLEDFDIDFSALLASDFPDFPFDDLNNADDEKWAEMLKEVDAWNRTHNVSAEEDTHTTTAPGEPFTYAVDPFTPEICKADLIRCPIPIPTPETDILAHFSIEYARSTRLLKVKYRWYHSSPSDWQKEVSTLISGIDNASNDLEPWLPLHRWLVLYRRLMQGATARERYKTKNFLLKKLEAMAKMRMEESKAAVVELLQAKGMKLAHGALCGMKRAVDEDCERRGSLLLGTIPEFTNELVGGFSGRWSWVD
ncbi:hypothetical protein J4E80_000032 [Alternaria sp. BMP 0032]|nr:hypothetical protein J4E80_000032 [Alternaria sp. BMP 0032]